MQKKYYMLAFIILLVSVAITFIYQVKHFSTGENDGLYLGVIVLAGIISYFVSKKMRQEHWFKTQSKKN